MRARTGPKRSRRQRQRRLRRATTAAPAVALLALCCAAAQASGAGHSGCRFPRVTGLVLSRARERAGAAGCELSVRGAAVRQESVQTIRRQSPAAGRHGRLLTVWLNQLCAESADPGRPQGEPYVSPGPTELISGLYVGGGPLRLRSAPTCEPRIERPWAGTIVVSDPQTGAVAAMQTVAAGQLAMIPLAPGTYTVTGTYETAIVNNQPARTDPETVTIPAGHTVREDVELDIP